MSLNSDYFITAVVTQRVAELTAEAERDRLAREALAGRPNWLQRHFAGRRRRNRAGFQPTPEPAPQQAPTQQPEPASQPEPVETGPKASARRELVGSGRVNGI